MSPYSRLGRAAYELRLGQILFFDNFRHAEEFRADLKSGALGGELVDFKMDCVSFDGQVYDPSQRGEPLALANGQDA